MNADRAGGELAVSFTSPAGEELTVEWDADALGRLEGGGSAGDVWRLAGELDWDEVEALRVLSGRSTDGRALAIAALRPRGAAGHGDEAIGGVIVNEGVTEELAEVLFSTEYAGDAEVRRIGLELYPSEDGMPLRVAADATATDSEVDGGVRRERVALDLRFAGSPGAGLLEILSTA